MSSILGIKLHKAYFFDTEGRYLGRKLIKTSSKRSLKIRTFKFQGGTYHFKPESSRVEACYFPWWFDDVHYFYTFNNPDPLVVTHGFIPKVNADDYNVQLESKVLRELNKVRQGGILSLLTPQTLIIILIIIGALIYFLSGGTLTAPQEGVG